MPATSFLVRPARDDDRLPLAKLFAAVAEERDGIATEPPVDLDARAASWEIDWIFVATAEHEVIGLVHLIRADTATATSRWPSRATGAGEASARRSSRRPSPLPASTASTSSPSPSSPTTLPRSRLYRKIGFVEEGRRVKHFRRESGELWDSVEMGLLL